ncbi:ectonucleoside triphosphate diphosphohydrolase 3 isoform 1-T3 [Synchiropus picturatus]
MASKQPLGFKCRFFVVVLLLLASIAALVTIAVIQHKWSEQEYGLEYGIVIDSGSSRSTIILYQWPGEKENETGVVTEVKSCKVPGDGISEMKVDPEKDAKSWKGFKACMANITKEIPPKKHKTTTLFLGATAGMRLLEAKDSKRASEVMASLREYLSSLPFKFQNASIISGQEEGLYGWITVNYLKGKFLERNTWNKFMRPNGADTVGSMDLGGASTQIAFAVSDDLKGADYLAIRLYGYDYNVYTHSYLCYGKNEAEKRVLDLIIRNSSDLTYVENPCYLEGSNVTLSYSAIYNTKCTEKPANINLDSKFLMVGAPDSERCGQIVRSIFDFKTCSSAQCSFNGVEQPPVRGGFMAYAGFFYTARAMLLNGTSELEQFRQGVPNFCNTHWKVMRPQRGWISDRYLRTYCYAVHYVFTLLHDGYKFDAETWRKIEFQEKVDGTSVGWSLGYMLSLSNMIPSEMETTTPLTDAVFAGLIFLFTALIVIAVILFLITLVRACY